MGLPALKQNYCQIDESAFEGTHLSTSFTVTGRGEQLLDIFNAYEQGVASIRALHELLSKPGMSTAAGYVFASNGNFSRRTVPSPTQTVAFAIKSLDVDCWFKAFHLTDAYQLMAEEDRSAWSAAFDSRDVPAFERDVVVDTLNAIIQSKSEYFARRVASVFKNLSGKHVTNPAHAFNTRIIMNYADGLGPTHSCVGYINDLRFIISMFLGLEAPHFQETYHVIQSIYKAGHFGEWFEFDGGAFRIKLFKKGTAHIEIDEDMAWRLNVVLASLFGPAIPREMRRTTTSNQRPPKYYQLREQNISDEILKAIASAKPAQIPKNGNPRLGYDAIPRTICFLSSNLTAAGKKEMAEVMIACGGVPIGIGGYSFQFDYEFRETVAIDIIRNRSIPESQSHQFFATSESLADELVDWADIDDGMTVCEPSAGTGVLAKRLPAGSVCVEISPLRCSVLSAMGLNATCADFLEWAKTADHFDRIVMNPPFSEGRAIRHVEAAMSLLNPGGIVVAIVPCTLKGKIQNPAYSVEWSDVLSDRFEHTSVSVRMVKITRTQ